MTDFDRFLTCLSGFGTPALAILPRSPSRRRALLQRLRAARFCLTAQVRGTLEHLDRGISCALLLPATDAELLTQLLPQLHDGSGIVQIFTGGGTPRHYYPDLGCARLLLLVENRDLPSLDRAYRLLQRTPLVWRDSARPVAPSHAGEIQ